MQVSSHVDSNLEVGSWGEGSGDTREVLGFGRFGRPLAVMMTWARGLGPDKSFGMLT